MKNNTSRDLKNREFIKHLWFRYCNTGDSLVSIASSVPVSTNHLNKLFKKEGFVKPLGSIKTSQGFLSLDDYESWRPFVYLYEQEGNSITTIAKSLNISNKTLSDIFKRLNVSTRSTEDNKKLMVMNMQNSLMEKYGVANAMHVDSFKNKIKQTNLEKYGADNVFKSDIIKNKIKQTKLEKYGDENYRNYDKARQTNLRKYGVVCNLNIDYVKDKVKKTPKNMDNFRKNKYSQTLHRWTQILDNKNITLLGEFKGTQKRDCSGKYIEWNKYDFICNKCNFTFKTDFGSDISCPKCSPCKRSKSERCLLNTIIDCCPNYIISNTNRNVIHPYEIDIFLPELNIGFEYNGSYWHNSLFKGQDYHKNKTELALSKGVKLYHIWEHDNENIVKSMVCGLLNKNINNLHARKLKIKKVESRERQIFFDTNHLHGDVKAKLAYGLYDGDELVSCISFRSHKEGIEIARFATKLHIRVRGGFSKLLKNSIPELKNLGYSKIITYCDRDWTPDYKDSVYYKNGFKFIKDTGCSLFYAQGNGNKVREPREKYQKHKLKQLFPDNYDDNKTANEILAENNILPCHNSGNWKLELDI